MNEPTDIPNPYDPPREGATDAPGGEPRQLVRAAVTGALWSVLSAFPITGAMALFFRFPVPFGSIERGISHVLPSIIALLFYGVLMGGFIVIAVCGSLAGITAAFLMATERKRRQLQRVLSILVTFAFLFALATLDWFIGPW